MSSELSPHASALGLAFKQVARPDQKVGWSLFEKMTEYAEKVASPGEDVFVRLEERPADASLRFCLTGFNRKLTPDGEILTTLAGSQYRSLTLLPAGLPLVREGNHIEIEGSETRTGPQWVTWNRSYASHFRQVRMWQNFTFSGNRDDPIEETELLIRCTRNDFLSRFLGLSLVEDSGLYVGLQLAKRFYDSDSYLFRDGFTLVELGDTNSDYHLQFENGDEMISSAFLFAHPNCLIRSVAGRDRAILEMTLNAGEFWISYRCNSFSKSRISSVMLDLMREGRQQVTQDIGAIGSKFHEYIFRHAGTEVGHA